MESIIALVQILERIKESQKALAAEEVVCKEKLMEMMKEEGLEKKKVPMALCAFNEEQKKNTTYLSKEWKQNLKQPRNWLTTWAIIKH